jgi:hypothetical protein
VEFVDGFSGRRRGAKNISIPIGNGHALTMTIYPGSSDDVKNNSVEFGVDLIGNEDFGQICDFLETHEKLAAHEIMSPSWP